MFLNLPLAKSGFQATVSLEEIINAVLYKLKTRVQWHQLPVKSLFEEIALRRKSVYYHYRKWYLADIFNQSWIGVLEKNKSKLDLSSVDFDGSHTSAIRGGEV